LHKGRTQAGAEVLEMKSGTVGREQKKKRRIERRGKKEEGKVEEKKTMGRRGDKDREG
jgi:hypothetical protein